MPTVHLAGNAVVLDGRVIQRCLICGEKLCDSLGCMVAPNVDGTVPEFATWTIGAWIEIEGHRSSEIGKTESPQFEARDIPENCCLELVER